MSLLPQNHLFFQGTKIIAVSLFFYSPFKSALLNEALSPWVLGSRLSSRQPWHSSLSCLAIPWRRSAQSYCWARVRRWRRPVVESLGTGWGQGHWQLYQLHLIARGATQMPVCVCDGVSAHMSSSAEQNQGSKLWRSHYLYCPLKLIKSPLQVFKNSFEWTGFFPATSELKLERYILFVTRMLIIQQTLTQNTYPIC